MGLNWLISVHSTKKRMPYYCKTCVLEIGSETCVFLSFVSLQVKLFAIPLFRHVSVVSRYR